MISDKLEVDSTWTLFLDRDGVINTLLPNDYVKTWEEFEWQPGVKLALAYLSRIFRYIIIVTNQQGVGKGLMTQDDLDNIHAQMKNEIEQSGGRIDAIYTATNTVENDTENMRKPGTKMLLMAKEKFEGLDFTKSVIVGDSHSDMEMGHALDIWTVLCNSTRDDIDADFRIDSLADCIHIFKT